MWHDDEPLSTLVGKTMKSVVADSDTVTFEAETGEQLFTGRREWAWGCPRCGVLAQVWKRTTEAGTK